MLLLRNWEFFLRETFINIRRNGLMSLAAISTVVVSLCILGSFLLAVVNLDALSSSVARKVEIKLYFLKPVTKKEAEAARQNVLKIPGVKDAQFVSRQDALDRLKKRFASEIDFSDIEKSNPLPDSVEVSVTDPEQIENVVARLKKLPGFEEPQYGKQWAEKILAFNHAVKVVGMVTAGLLSLSILLIINNTIRLTIFARRREIRIMQLVGATNWFIKVPFLMEGIFHGLIGSIAASLLLLPGYSYLVKAILRTNPFFPMVPAQAILFQFLGVINLMGLMFGYSGSLISIRKFLASL